MRRNKARPSKPSKTSKRETPSPKVHFYTSWCKRCGICVAVCPKKAIETDEWGYPRLTATERCTLCHTCEKLCPDFAISVAEKAPAGVARRASSGPSPGSPGSPVSPQHSPERVAPGPPTEEEDHE